ncbi:hypothetical protein ACOSP7_008321 [Xanthoceras sorbifolium]
MSKEIGELLGGLLGVVKEVDVGVNGSCWGSCWRFIGFYGDPNATCRSHSWSLLRRLAGLSNLPWLVGGDFNEILRWEEKSGGLFRSHKAVSLFRGTTDDCNLVDVGFRGHDFTWSNKQLGANLIQERLDRYLCSMSWRSLFPIAVNVHLDWGGSDHKPIMMENIQVTSVKDSEVCHVKARFHFEEAWIGEPDCLSVVEKAWHVSPGSNVAESLSDRVGNTLLAVLNHGADLGEMSRAVVALIPKVKSPVKISDFRPISLCNVTYKLVAKVLANRLKLVLHDIIAPNQSAFVPSRLITDNVVVGFECLHHLNGCRQSPHGLAALKLDMSKAYDRVEWIFLQKMIEQLGFDSGWIAKVMSCITSASYSFLINGEPKGFVKPSRGLRQGCPLSPYLFLLCAEGLTSLLSRVEVQGKLHGIKVARYAPAISHLFFADDSLISLRASSSEGRALKETLCSYEAASGQSINFEKSALTFSPNTAAGVVLEVRNMFNVDVVASHDKYLGLPSSVGRNRKGVFGSILDRVWNKLQGWKGKLFSTGGKEVLIKAVAQAVPSYAMSCFKLPVSLGLEIQKLCADFWWGSSKEKRKMHWFSWKRMCQPKNEGGMGFREFQAFNKAMLAKQGWRILNDPSSLLSRVLKAKYFPKSNFLSSKLGWKPLFVWRSILWGREVIRKGVRWKIGNGQSISIYDDSWLPRDSSFRVYSPRLLPDGVSVSALIGAPGRWKADIILSIPLCSSPLRDSLIWHFDKKGCFSVKSACKLALKDSCSDSPFGSRAPSPWWKKLWELQIPSKIKIFCWRACREALPTRGCLFKRGIGDSNLCPFCSRVPESVDHAFWGCKANRSSWKECPFFSELNFLRSVDFFDRFVWVFSCCSLKQVLCFVVGSWFALSDRNLRIHNTLPPPVSNLWSKALCFVDSSLLSIQVPLQVVSASRSVPRWSPPLAGFKFNVDAAVDVASGKFGVGIVARDQRGCLKSAAALIFPSFFSVAAAEARAVFEGFKLAVSSSLSPFFVESDSLEIVKLCGGFSSTRCEVDSIIQDILFHFDCFSDSLAFVSRNCNNVAHCLAKWVYGVFRTRFDFILSFTGYLN